MQLAKIICHGDRYLADLFKNNHICQLQEIVVTPDIEFARVIDKSLNIQLYKIYIRYIVLIF